MLILKLLRGQLGSRDGCESSLDFFDIVFGSLGVMCGPPGVTAFLSSTIVLLVSGQFGFIAFPLYGVGLTQLSIGFLFRPPDVVVNLVFAASVA